MIIRNNTSGIWATSIQGSLLKILPGENEIELGAYKALLNHRGFLSQVEYGLFEVIGDVEVEEEVAELDFVDLNAREAKKVINDTDDVEVLRELEQIEREGKSRSSVIEEIQERIDKLTNLE